MDRQPGHPSWENAGVFAALTSLGYSAAEATAAISSLRSNPNLSLGEQVTVALCSTWAGISTGKPA